MHLNLPFLESVILHAFLCFLSVGDGLVQPEALNKKAIQIINRVRDKLTGKFCSTSTETDKKELNYREIADFLVSY